jgi:hypothetical protein
MKSESTAVHDVPAQAETLLRSLKGVQHVRVHTDAHGRIARIVVLCPGMDERSALRNVQTALFAVLGIALEPGVLQVNPADEMYPRQNVVPAAAVAQPKRDDDAHVLDIASGARRADLNEAARVAFDTLRAAQSSFHGFVFDGAELVKISGAVYVVVAVHRVTTNARYCGAAPVLDSVGTASARALMNAVAVAAMASPASEYASNQQLELNA